MYLATTGTKGNHYHGTANTAANQDCMLIGTQSFAAMQHANNANTLVINDNMTAMQEEVMTLHQALVSMQQQLALLAHQGPPQQAPTMSAAWQV